MIYLQSNSGPALIYGILLVSGYFAFSLLMILVLKPIQRVFNTTKDVETLVWFGIALIYVVYKLITF